MSSRVQAAVSELRRRLAILYGDRLAKVVLFGSQARGDAEPDSDIDVMIVLRGQADHEIERKRVTPITSEISLKHNVVILCFYMSESRYERGDTSLLQNVRAEGVAI